MELGGVGCVAVDPLQEENELLYIRINMSYSFTVAIEFP